MDRHHNDDEKNIYNTSYQNAHGGRRGKIDPFSHLHNQRRIYDIARATEIDYQIFIKPYSNDHLSIIWQFHVDVEEETQIHCDLDMKCIIDSNHDMEQMSTNENTALLLHRHANLNSLKHTNFNTILITINKGKFECGFIQNKINIDNKNKNDTNIDFW